MKAIKHIDPKVFQDLGSVRDGDWAMLNILLEKVNELVTAHNDYVASKQRNVSVTN